MVMLHNQYQSDMLIGTLEFGFDKMSVSGRGKAF